MTAIIDAWMQIPTPRLAAEPSLKTVQRWTAQDADAMIPDVASTLAAMDSSGIETGLVCGWHGPNGALISNDEVAKDVAASNGRLKGVMSVDLSDPMNAVREIRTRAAQGFVGLRILPWLWSLPPNDRRYYPIYAACIDAGLPFCTQIGHTGPLRSSDVGRLIPYLEDVMLDFPELVIVGGHVGFPWIDEVTSMLHKFPNFYVDTSAYALHRLPPAFVSLMKNEGRARILFGSNWPMLSPARCLKGLDALNLDDETKTLFLRENSKKVFRL